jgi:hypothetical protein
MKILIHHSFSSLHIHYIHVYCNAILCSNKIVALTKELAKISVADPEPF